jgi:hypothetical protein
MSEIFIKLLPKTSPILCQHYYEIKDNSNYVSIYKRTPIATGEDKEQYYQIIFSQITKDKLLGTHSTLTIHSDTLVLDILNVENKFPTEEKAEQALLEIFKLHNFKILDDNLKQYI